MSPASSNLKSKFSASCPSTSVAWADWSSTAAQRTPWLGSNAVGYHAISESAVSRPYCSAVVE